MKFVAPRPFADPEAAAQKLMEIANAVEAVQDGRIFIELINGPFLYDHIGSPAEYGAGLKLAIERGWLWKHESGTYVKLTLAHCLGFGLQFLTSFVILLASFVIPNRGGALSIDAGQLGRTEQGMPVETKLKFSMPVGSLAAVASGRTAIAVDLFQHREAQAETSRRYVAHAVER